MDPGPRASQVQLSESQEKLLRQYSNKASISRHMHQRITIVLQAHQGNSNLGIARSLSITANTVKKWRDRWVDSYEQLCFYERDAAQQQELSGGKRVKRMLAILSDAPRSGTPVRISLAEKQKLMALACKKPEDFGVPMTRWNREMLAQIAQEQGIVEKISPRYVGKLLKNPPTTAPQKPLLALSQD